MITIFFAVCLLICVVTFYVTLSVVKSNDKLSKILMRLILFGGITVFIYGLCALSVNLILTYICYSLYVCFAMWLIVSLMGFVAVYAKIDNVYKKYKKIIVFLTTFDSIAILSNIFTHKLATFTLTPMAFGRAAYIVNRNPAIYIHFNYLIIINIVFLIMLLHVVYKNRGVYRIGYILILASYLVIFMASYICRAMNTYFDYSVFFYGLLGLSIYLLVYKYVPYRIEKNIKSLIISNINDALFGLDVNVDLAYMNDVAKDLIKYYKIKDPKAYYSKIYIEKSLESKEEFEWEFTRKIYNKQKYYSVIYKKMYDKKNRYIGDYIILHDKTKEAEKNIEQAKLVIMDQLTGLYKKSYFEIKVGEKLNDINEDYYMIMSDIKNFKLINEFYGSLIGDKVLIKIADVMKKEFKNNDDVIYGRIGIDKFIIFIPKRMYSEIDLYNKVNVISSIVDNLNVYVYMGIYLVNKNENVESMIEHASLAASLIKHNPSKKINFYDESIKDNLFEENLVISSFDKALQNNEFKLYIQPQISKEDKVLGGEALVRWVKDGKVIPPGKFIPLLEKSGLICDLDKFMWEEACKKIKDWSNKNIDYYISINLSAIDFFSMDIYKVLTGLVKKYKISPEKLKLEITESVFVSNVSELSKLISKLKKYGFIIEMDDFGSGYSSLNMLKNIDIDVIKMDMGFLFNEEKSDKSRVILRALIELSKNLDLDVITEGVETKEQVDYLKLIGCDIFQGYFFDKPISVEAFENKYLK